MTNDGPDPDRPDPDRAPPDRLTPIAPPHPGRPRRAL